MRKKIITVLLVLVTIINLIVGVLLFVDIQMLQAPEVTITIDVIEVNAEESIIQTTIDIANPNSFGFIAKNLEVVTTIPSGDKIARMLIDGGNIPPHGNKTFTAAANVAFDGHSPEILITRITGIIGVNIGFIQKTLPLAINIITSAENVIKDIAPPVVHVQVDFGEITQESINITGVIETYNPNTFNIVIGNVSIEVETETGRNVGNLDISGGVVAAKSSLNLTGSGRILLEALNAKMLMLNMSGIAGVKIAGINKSISFFADAKITVPDLGALLSSDLPTDVIIKGDFKVSAKGLIDDITLEIHNPNKIALVGKDIVVSLYRIDNDEKLLLGECELEEGVVEPEDVTFFKGQLLIPYSKLILPGRGRFLPDWMLVTVRGNVTIQGLNQSIWIGVSGYQDFHLFK